MTGHIKFIFALILTVGLGLDSMAQLEYSPARGSFYTENYRVAKSSKVNTLPFFEDFSTHRGQPDTAKWEPFGGTLVNQGAQFHPVSQGVASFDGLDYTGAPYEFQINFPKGQADELVSKPFDLTSYAANFGLA